LVHFDGLNDRPQKKPHATGVAWGFFV